jgi:hypothetical protein
MSRWRMARHSLDISIGGSSHDSGTASRRVSMLLRKTLITMRMKLFLFFQNRPQHASAIDLFMFSAGFVKLFFSRRDGEKEFSFPG